MKSAYEKIRAGLEDAIAFAEGDASRGRVHVVPAEIPDVRALRLNLDLTQEVFARLIRVNVATLRNWEQGRRHPSGPALTLLHVLEREPRAAIRALHPGRTRGGKGSGVVAKGGGERSKVSA